MEIKLEPGFYGIENSSINLEEFMCTLLMFQSNIMQKQKLSTTLFCSNFSKKDFNNFKIKALSNGVRNDAFFDLSKLHIIDSDKLNIPYCEKFFEWVIKYRKSRLDYQEIIILDDLKTIISSFIEIEGVSNFDFETIVRKYLGKLIDLNTIVFFTIRDKNDIYIDYKKTFIHIFSSDRIKKQCISDRQNPFISELDPCRFIKENNDSLGSVSVEYANALASKKGESEVYYITSKQMPNVRFNNQNENPLFFANSYIFSLFVGFNSKNSNIDNICFLTSLTGDDRYKSISAIFIDNIFDYIELSSKWLGIELDPENEDHVIYAIYSILRDSMINNHFKFYFIIPKSKENKINVKSFNRVYNEWHIKDKINKIDELMYL